MVKAAGILFLTDDGQTLLLRRGPGGDWPGAWCFPGGKSEPGETAEETAVRECEEELGFCPDGTRLEWTRRISANEAPIPAEAINPVPPLGEPVDYTTFIQRVPKKFEPELNGEHTAFVWTPIDLPMHPLHPGAQVSLRRFQMNELNIAQAIRDGDLVSPTKYENVWLFAMRITGTGTAYRSKLDEIVYRDPALYLTDEFLQRCNGLPVIWEHPQRGKLDTKEFADRVVGTILLPYLKGDEVWGVAKIYDEQAAQTMIDKQLSTSPAVVFRSTDGNKKAKMEDGSNVLIEGKPSLLDHLAICEEGVWDKGGDPVGVELPTTIETSKGSDMPEVENEVKGAEERDDAETSGGNLDKILKGVTALCDRLDAMEKRMDSMAAPRMDRHRKDDDDRARKDDDAKRKDDDKRMDRHRKDDDDRMDDDDDDAKRHRKDDDRKDARRKDDDDDRYDRARKDAKRKDDDEDEEMPGEPREMAADKHHRKDDDDDRRKDDDKRMSRKDTKRKDDDEEESEHPRMDAQRRPLDRYTASELRRLAEVVASMPKSMSDADYAEMADAQARADSVYGAFGERAPAPLQGETPTAYRVRLAKGMQKHSASWREVRLRDLPANALQVAEQQIYADAQSAARNPVDLGAGMLREIRRHDASGRVITEFVGDSNAWMGEFRTPPRSITKPFFRPRAQG